MVDQRTFAVVLEPEEEGGFTVRVPSLPEIVTYGRDEDEALAMAEDVIRLVLDDMAARGEPVPVDKPPHIREVMVHWPHDRAIAIARKRGKSYVHLSEPASSSRECQAATAVSSIQMIRAAR